MIELDDEANGQECVLQNGQRFEIRLRENPTTGFTWSLEANGEPVCALVDHAYEAAGGPPGQGGSHRWQFRAAQMGQGAIEMVMRRPWETTVAPARRFALRISVAG